MISATSVIIGWFFVSTQNNYENNFSKTHSLYTTHFDINSVNLKRWEMYLKLRLTLQLKLEEKIQQFKALIMLNRIGY